MLKLLSVLLATATTVSAADRAEMLMKKWNVRPFNPVFACTSYDLSTLTDLSADKWGMEMNTIDRAPANSYVVHHIVLFSCRTKNAMWERYTSGGECSFSEMELSACGKIVWTSQSPLPRNYTVPANTGIPFNLAENRFLIMEIHYENLKFVGGVDSSGIEFVFTNKRPFIPFVFQEYVDAAGIKILGDSIYLNKANTTGAPTPVPAAPIPTPAGATPTPAGATPTPAGATPTPAGATPTPAGATPTPAGATPTPAGSTPTPAGAIPTASSTASPPGDGDGRNGAGEDDDDDGANVGLIIGMIVLGLVAVISAAAVAFKVVKKQQQQMTFNDHQEDLVEMR